MEKYFEIALKEAEKAYKHKEVPVGAIIVKDGKIIAKSHNNRQKKHIVLGHAEVNCIQNAAKKLKDWRLDGCELYVTLEPCQMCQAIIEESRIKSVFYLLQRDFQQKKGKKSIFLQTNDCETVIKTYENLLKKFFSNLRNKI